MKKIKVLNVLCTILFVILSIAGLYLCLAVAKSASFGSFLIDMYEHITKHAVVASEGKSAIDVMYGMINSVMILVVVPVFVLYVILSAVRNGAINKRCARKESKLEKAAKQSAIEEAKELRKSEASAKKEAIKNAKAAKKANKLAIKEAKKAAKAKVTEVVEKVVEVKKEKNPEIIIEQKKDSVNDFLNSLRKKN